MKKKALWLAKQLAGVMGLFLCMGGVLSCHDGSRRSHDIAVTSVSITSTDFQLKVGATKQLNATVLPENATNKTVTWRSSDETIATVDSSGLVTAMQTEGEATIIATAGSQNGNVIVKVVKEFTFKPTTRKYMANQLGLTGIQALSSDEAVATVAVATDGTVTITSTGEGTATITVKDAAGNKATVEITVEEDGSITETRLTPYKPNGGGEAGEPPISGPTVADVSNAEVKIVKSEGWLNSAYIIFEQIEGATYKVLIDDQELDGPLIRYYNTYTYYEASESNGQTTWSKKTLSKVVRADALGLAAGSHTMKVCAVGTENQSSYSTATMTVADHDRSGFAFTGSKTPGAYNKDGTLKSGAIVIYLTQENKKTVTATIGGKEYTGIQDITQAIKTKNTGGKAVAIRVIGMVKAENNDLSCNDHKSSYALGVKEASEVTIEGVGHDATLFNAGVAAFNCAYIEIANLGLMKWGGGKDGDGIALKGGAEGYIWVHNNDVFYGDAGSDGDQVKGDGSMDLKDDTKYVTIAYNHFWDSGKMSLCGMKSESGPNYITYHHNWFDHSDSRHPRIRTMTVHIYNNYFDGNAKYGVGVTSGASAFVEGNYFRNAHNPMLSSKQGTDALGAGTFSGEAGGVIKAYNNEFAEKNTNGVKFQFLTNKYDYTNNKALGEYKEWTETIGTQTADGWVIYDSKKTSSSDTIATNSLIAVEDATTKDGNAYYQVSKSKTAFFIDVPKNTTKIVINAKTGTSGSGATSGIAIKNESGSTIASVSNIGNSTYQDYDFSISGLSADSTLEIANTSGSNSLNISGIKVIAASGWSTKLTSGADPTNIDAYEVSNRNDTVPANVKTRSGGTTYNNFDTTKGNSGLGLSANPTTPEQAKKDVLTYSGRHNPDFAHTFSNKVDDASYAKNDALNNALVAYTSGLTKMQGAGETASSGGNSSSSGSSGSGTTSTDVKPEGFVAVGVYGFSTSSVSGATHDKIFSKQDAGSVQKAHGFAVSCKIDSAGLNLKTDDGGILVFALNDTLKLSFTDDNSKGVVISTEDGYVGTSGTNKSSTLTSAAKLELGSGIYTVVGATSSSAKIKSFTFEK